MVVREQKKGQNDKLALEIWAETLKPKVLAFLTNLMQKAHPKMLMCLKVKYVSQSKGHGFISLNYFLHLQYLKNSQNVMIYRNGYLRCWALISVYLILKIYNDVLKSFRPDP